MRRALRPNTEREIALRTMGIDREHTPDDLISAGRQRLERYAELRPDAFVDRRFTGLHGRTFFVAHVDTAEAGLKLVGERQHDLFRRLSDGSAGRRARLVEMGMRESDASRREQKCKGHDDAHG